MADPLHLQGTPLRGPTEHPRYDCCLRALTITLLVISVIGILAGVFAFLVSSGNLVTDAAWLNAMGQVGVTNSYLMMGGCTILFVFVIISLICQRNR